MGCGYSYGYSRSRDDWYFKTSVMGTTVYNGFVVCSVLPSLLTAVLIFFGPEDWSIAGRRIRLVFVDPAIDPEKHDDVEWHYVELSPWKKILGLVCVLYSCYAWNKNETPAGLTYPPPWWFQTPKGRILSGWLVLIFTHAMMIRRRLLRRQTAIHAQNTGTTETGMLQSDSDACLQPGAVLQPSAPPVAQH